MIDTMYICLKIKDKNEYKKIRSKVYEATKNIPRGNLHKDKNDENAEVTFGFAKYGFTEMKLRRVLAKKYKFYFIELKLRPKLLVEKNNYYDVIYINEIDEARKRFNEIIQKIIKLDLPDFLYWNVKRIDYAIDLIIDKTYIQKYISLFKKSNIQYYLLENPTTQKFFEKENNFYLCSKNYRINYYDRYMTLLEKQENSKKEFYNIEKVKNVLRIETQIYVNAPKMIERKKIVNNQVIDFVRLDICQVIVENYFNSLIGKGNYYICDKAFKIIDEKVKSFRMQVLLKNILRLINKEGGIYAAKKNSY